MSWLLCESLTRRSRKKLSEKTDGRALWWVEWLPDCALAATISWADEVKGVCLSLHHPGLAARLQLASRGLHTAPAPSPSGCSGLLDVTFLTFTKIKELSRKMALYLGFFRYRSWDSDSHAKFIWEWEDPGSKVGQWQRRNGPQQRARHQPSYLPLWAAGKFWELVWNLLFIVLLAEGWEAGDLLVPSVTTERCSVCVCVHTHTCKFPCTSGLLWTCTWAEKARATKKSLQTKHSRGWQLKLDLFSP